MKILEQYILRRVVLMFLTALLPVLAIIWTTQVLRRINLVTDSGQSVGSFMVLATMILPTIVATVLPFALVIGITHTLTTMNNDSELAVIDAAGAPRSIIQRPLIIFAAGLSFFSFVMMGFVEPAMRVNVRTMIATAYADLLSSVIEERTFRQIEPGLFVQISERQSGRAMKGLLVADSRDPASELIYYAREGAVDETGKALVMQDGEVQRKAPNGDVTVIRFDRYAFDLSDLSEERGQARYGAKDRDLLYLMDPDPLDERYVDKPNDFSAELHRRISSSFLPLVFALISLMLCGDARSHREARLHPMASALIMALTLFWASNYLTTLAETSSAFLPLLYLLPLGSGSAALFMLATNRSPRLPKFLSSLIEAVATVTQKRMGVGTGGSA
ncbi:LPS export ABC transporter permease LptF [Rhizobium sp. WL3]|uniref:LPS export ABC transporter permease LptF n=1 Tax=Rhizobium rhizophilum TaxID=1850373 RepID=A0ABY2QWX9_9HYPH|nr:MULTISPECIES: LPS export ABC transporter permease LptF [Rhizobium]QEE47294.1 LPS export ABC transporter permease LptF [Rhizobium sp. WL3]THV14056.1 LPS export ABC transporter permease LptF [Rhizobium rhizophilum]